MSKALNNYIEALEVLLDDAEDRERVAELKAKAFESLLEDQQDAVRLLLDLVHSAGVEEKKLKEELSAAYRRIHELMDASDELEWMKEAYDDAAQLLDIYNRHALHATLTTGSPFLDSLNDEDRELMSSYYEWLNEQGECCGDEECCPETLDTVESSNYCAGPQIECCERDTNKDGDCDRQATKSPALGAPYGESDEVTQCAARCGEARATRMVPVSRSDSVAELHRKFAVLIEGQLGQDFALAILPQK